MNPELPTSVIHFTDKFEDLVSILEFGFIASPQPTEILRRVVGDRVLPEAMIQGGLLMSFTSTDTANLHRHHEAFGRFGIALRAFPLHANGVLRKVRYLDPEGHRVGHWRRIANRFAPPELLRAPRLRNDKRTLEMHDIFGILMNAQSAFIASGQSPPWLHGAPIWEKLIDRLRFCQTDAHAWENEWRLVNPAPMQAVVRATIIGKAIAENRDSVLRELRAIKLRCQRSGMNRVDRDYLSRWAYSPRPEEFSWIEVPAEFEERARYWATKTRTVRGFRFDKLTVRARD